MSTRALYMISLSTAGRDNVHVLFLGEFQTGHCAESVLVEEEEVSFDGEVALNQLELGVYISLLPPTPTVSPESSCFCFCFQCM